MIDSIDKETVNALQSHPQKLFLTLLYGSMWGIT